MINFEEEYVVENVEKYLEDSNIANLPVEKSEEQLSFIKFKKHEGFNETNLMTLPFISLKRKPEQIISRSWKKSNDEIVSLEVVGGAKGVPQIAELDVLLALFRIHLKNNKNRFTQKKTNMEDKKNTKVDIPKKIHFTYFELAKEVGYAKYGGKQKEALEKSIKKLNETTIYNKFAIFDASKGEFVSMFKGEKSCRILKNYTSYTEVDFKREEGRTLKPNEIKDYQYVEIDDFFLSNMCNNYYKIYDYEKYKELKSAVAKRIFLILNTWSKGNKKVLSYESLVNYIGLDYETPKEKNYARDLINRAMKELKEINYIDDFKKKRSEGIEIIFNQRSVDVENYKHMFNKFSEIMEELRTYGINYDEMPKITEKVSEEYLKGLLRNIRYNVEVKGNNIKNKRQYFLSALKERWDVSQFK